MCNGFTRRDFLKYSVIGGVALGTGLSLRLHPCGRGKGCSDGGDLPWRYAFSYFHHHGGDHHHDFS